MCLLMWMKMIQAEVYTNKILLLHLQMLCNKTGNDSPTGVIVDLRNNIQAIIKIIIKIPVLMFFTNLHTMQSCIFHIAE